MNYRKIAVAIDFSDPSRHALREAGRLAGRSGGEVLVLHLFEEHAAHLFTNELRGDPDDLHAALHDRLEEWSHAVVASGVPLRKRIIAGSPGRDLLREAEEFGADLLVMGTRGRSHPHRRLGTVAGMLTRQARMPVLLANPDASPIQSIVAGIDYSPISSVLMDHALTIAEVEGLEVHVVHNEPSAHDSYANLTLTSGLEPYAGRALDPEQIRAIDAENARKLEEFVADWQERARPRRLRHLLTQNLDDARGLLAYLDRVPNPLVILGAHGRSGLRDALMGTTTERVLHGCPGNALVIRERYVNQNLR